MKSKILVTGSSGQLAACIKDLGGNRDDILYANSSQLDITDELQVKKFFQDIKIDWCINCAAYTAVDKAESNYDNAYNINANGPKYLAQACKKNGARLVHISTDFVFDGEQNKPYKESHTTNPIGVYGETKLKGEQQVAETLKEHFIIRTSWLYSEYGHNFLKTMLRLSKDKTQLGVVGDQIGTPTYAKDLAKLILHIVDNNVSNFGVYHYSNNGSASWYDFAKAIFDISNTDIQLKNISTAEFLTAAKRPHYSVLDKTKTQANFNIKIPYWRDSLKAAIKNLENKIEHK